MKVNVLYVLIMGLAVTGLLIPGDAFAEATPAVFLGDSVISVTHGNTFIQVDMINSEITYELKYRILDSCDSTIGIELYKSDWITHGDSDYSEKIIYDYNNPKYDLSDLILGDDYGVSYRTWNVDHSVKTEFTTTFLCVNTLGVGAGSVSLIPPVILPIDGVGSSMTITGTAGAGSIITLYNDGLDVGTTTTADPQYTWSISNVPVNLGANVFTATTSFSSETSVLSTPVTITSFENSLSSPLSIASPSGVSTITIDSTPYALVTGTNGAIGAVYIYDVTNPSSPSLQYTIGDIYRTNGVSTITIDSTPYALVTGSSAIGAVYIYNISDPSSPSLQYTINDIENPGGVSTITIDSTPYALVTDTSDFIHMYDISDPSSPSLQYTIGDIENPSGVSTITIDSTPYALVTDVISDFIHIYDISDPSSLSLQYTINDIENPGGVSTITIDSTPYALVTGTSSDFIHIYDISDPSSPSLQHTIGDIKSPGDISTITIGTIPYVFIIFEFDNSFSIMSLASLGTTATSDTAPGTPTGLTATPSDGYITLSLSANTGLSQDNFDIMYERNNDGKFLSLPDDRILNFSESSGDYSLEVFATNGVLHQFKVAVIDDTITSSYTITDSPVYSSKLYTSDTPSDFTENYFSTMTFDDTNNILYILDSSPEDTEFIIKVNPTTGTVIDTLTHDANFIPMLSIRDIEYYNNALYSYVESPSYVLYKYDITEDLITQFTVEAETFSGARVDGIGFGDDELYLFNSGDYELLIFDLSGNLKATVPETDGTTYEYDEISQMVYSQYNDALYIANDEDIIVIQYDNADDTVITSTITIPNDTPGSNNNLKTLALDSTNNYIYAANTETGLVHVIDTDTNDIIQTISIPGAAGLTFDVDSGRIFVATNDHTVTSIDIATFETTVTPLSTSDTTGDFVEIQYIGNNKLALLTDDDIEFIATSDIPIPTPSGSTATPDTTSFITTWTVTGTDLGITIPVGGATGEYTVNWGDTTSDVDITGDAPHTYGTAGTYKVTISGDFTRIYLADDHLNARQLTTIEQWGSDIKWESMNSAFKFSSNVSNNATDSPDLSSVTDMSTMFYDSSFNGIISGWDTSSVTDMSTMFRYSSFNGDISDWNTSSVTDMSDMFLSDDDRSRSPFTGDISNWNTSSVTDMSQMFHYSSFDGDISDWDTSSVTNMNNMFYDSSFNGIISDWDTSSVDTMSSMFYDTSFTGDISNWNTTSVIDMRAMFYNSPFNGIISDWDTSSVDTMSSMFYDTSFTGDISNWNTTSVTDMSGMFQFSSFNNNISNWNTTSVIDMRAMFYNSPFNGIISDWDVSDVTDMRSMFDFSPFAQNLGPWYVVLDDNEIESGDEAKLVGSISAQNSVLDSQTPVYTVSPANDGASFVITGNSLYLNDTPDYNTQSSYSVTIESTGNFGTSNSETFTINVVDIPDTTSFITTWTVTGTDLGITIPVGGATGEYTVNWGDTTSDVDITGDAPHTYDAAGTYKVTISGDFTRIYLADDYLNAGQLTTIEQWGSDIKWESMNSAFVFSSNVSNNATDSPDLSSVTDMTNMFADSSFTGDISNWNTANVSDMSQMFRYSSFNGDISDWDVSDVDDMSQMFDSSSFNNNISNWNTTSVTTMAEMFYDSPFNRDISNWNTTSVIDMRAMFYNSPFNGIISDWDVSDVTDMRSMFDFSPFAQNLGPWYVVLGNTEIESGDITGFVGSISAQNSILSDQNPVYTISPADDGASFEIIDNSLYLKDTPVSVTPSSYDVTILSTGDFGTSNSVILTINVVPDITAPAVPVISPVTTPTSDTAPTIIGTAEANSTVKLFDDSSSPRTLLGSTTANSDGTWSITIPTQSPGTTLSLVATATDADTNTSDDSASMSLEITTSGGGSSSDPTPPGIPLFTNSTGTINITPVIIGGTNDEVDSTIQLFNNGNSVGTVTTAGDETWEFPTVSLDEGLNVFTATASDGTNTSDTSESITITLDTVPPTFDVDGNTVDFTTSVELGDTYTLGAINSIDDATATTELIGDVSNIAETAPAVGSYTITYTVTDAATNSHTITETVTVTDTTTSFITTWTVTGTDLGITIPVGGATGTYTVDWGDNTTIETVDGIDATHTYGTAGTYTVIISGDFTRIHLQDDSDNSGKLSSIKQWGEMKWESMHGAFSGTNHLTNDAGDKPDLSRVTNMASMFSFSQFTGIISDWDVSSVTIMSNMFESSQFTGDISNWNTANVSDMSSMFADTSFTGDISNWDTSSVLTMATMFQSSSFNGDISEWDVSDVDDMYGIFSYSSFNRDISEWDVSDVDDMDDMFDASSFAQNLGAWYAVLDDNEIESGDDTKLVGSIFAQNSILDSQNPTYTVSSINDGASFEIIDIEGTGEKGLYLKDTPDDTQSSYSVTVDVTNVAFGTSNSVTFDIDVIDTTPPTVPTDITISHDGTNTYAVSGDIVTVTFDTEAGSTVTGTIDGKTATGVVIDTTGTLSLTLDGNGTEGTDLTFSFVQTDASSNSQVAQTAVKGTGSDSSVTADFTALPVTIAIPEFSTSDTVLNTLTTDLVTGTSDATMNIDLLRAEDDYTASTTSDSSGEWKYSSIQLLAGTNTFTVTASDGVNTSDVSDELLITYEPLEIDFIDRIGDNTFRAKWVNHASGANYSVLGVSDFGLLFEYDDNTHAFVAYSDDGNIKNGFTFNSGMRTVGDTPQNDVNYNVYILALKIDDTILFQSSSSLPVTMVSPENPLDFQDLKMISVTQTGDLSFQVDWSITEGTAPITDFWINGYLTLDDSVNKDYKFYGLVTFPTGGPYTYTVNPATIQYEYGDQLDYGTYYINVSALDSKGDEIFASPALPLTLSHGLEVTTSVTLDDTQIHQTSPDEFTTLTDIEETFDDISIFIPKGTLTSSTTLTISTTPEYGPLLPSGTEPIMIQFGDAPVGFTIPISITLHGKGAIAESGSDVFYYHEGDDDYTKIAQCGSLITIDTISSDVLDYFNSSSLSECYLVADSDVKIWTNHLTNWGVIGASSDSSSDPGTDPVTDPTDDTKKKSGGGCSDCTPPTLGKDSSGVQRVWNGIGINGHFEDGGYFYTEYPMQYTEIGKLNNIVVKYWENQGPYNIEVIQLGIGAKEVGTPLGESQALIEVWMDYFSNDIENPVIGNVKVIDPDGILNYVAAVPSLANCDQPDEQAINQCLQVEFVYSYAKVPDSPVLMANAFDYKRNTINDYFNDGLTVIDPNPVIEEIVIDEKPTKECLPTNVPTRVTCYFADMVEYEKMRAQATLEKMP